MEKRLSTRKMAIAGMLGGLSVVLSVTPFLGFIPLPFLGGVSATIMHIPVIIGAITAGPMVGLFVGLIFGISSFLRATPAFFADPLISILPRLFIGLTAYGAYKLTKNSIIAAMVGTATNTIGVLTMIYVLGYLRPLSVVMGIAAVNGTAEVIVSAIIVYAIMQLLKKVKL